MKCFKFLFRFFIPLLITFSFFSCDLFEEWFSEEEPEEIGYVLDSIAVGPDGGTLKSDMAEIEIPAGAFTYNQTIKLIETEGRNVPQGSSVFIIDGISEAPAKPIKFRLRSENEPGTDEQGIFVFERDTDTIPSPAPAEYNNGWFEADVKLSDRIENSGNGDMKSVTSISRIFWYKTTKFKLPTDHFLIYFDLSDGKSKMEKIGQYLDDAYLKFKEMGFECDINRGPVYVWEMDGNKYGMLNKNNITGRSIFVNNKFLNKMESIKVTVSHELFHWIQYEYDYTYYGDLKNLWLDEAFAVWSEQLFSSTPHYPSVISGNEYEPFEGLQKGSLRLPGDAAYSDRDLKTHHGYGCASFIKYLVRKYGMGYPIKVYKKLRNDVHPVKAIYQSTQNQMASYWQDYLEELMTDQLYVNPSSPYHMSFGGYNSPWVSGRVMIKTADTSVTFTNNYVDLSARMFKVEVDPSFKGYDPGMKLKFKVDQTTNMEAISIFKIDERDIELLGATYDSIVVSGFDELNKNHHHIYAMVSNSNFQDSPASYTNETPISLTIETVGEPAGCRGGIVYDAVMKTISDETIIDTVESFIDYFPYAGKAFKLPFAEGELTGNEFKATYETTVPLSDGNSMKYTGKIEVKFNNAKDLILQFYWINESHWKYYGKDIYYNTEVTCVDLPFYKTEDDITYFGLEGKSVSSHISEIKYHERLYNGTRELIEVLPSSESVISVAFNQFEDL